MHWMSNLFLGEPKNGMHKKFKPVFTFKEEDESVRKNDGARIIPVNKLQRHVQIFVGGGWNLGRQKGYKFGEPFIVQPD